MKPAGGSIEWAWVAAIAVIGSALWLVSCDGPFPGGGSQPPGPGSTESADGSPGDGVLQQDPRKGVHADTGIDDSRPADPTKTDDPCGRCGNGAVDCKESCDDGNELTERCADPRVDPEAERNVRVCGNDCRWALCRIPYCGDEIVDSAADEECDEGPAATRTCARGCKLTECGRQANLDAFQDDYDCDGSVDKGDNCPEAHNPDQADTDKDGTGDLCEPTGGECTIGRCGPGCGGASVLIINTDLGYTRYAEDFDSDGWEDEFDNCPLDFNTSQADSDEDGVGDACDPQVCPSACR